MKHTELETVKKNVKELQKLLMENAESAEIDVAVRLPKHYCC